MRKFCLYIIVMQKNKICAECDWVELRNKNPITFLFTKGIFDFLSIELATVKQKGNVHPNC